MDSGEIKYGIENWNKIKSIVDNSIITLEKIIVMNLSIKDALSFSEMYKKEYQRLQKESLGKIGNV